MFLLLYRYLKKVRKQLTLAAVLAFNTFLVFSIVNIGFFAFLLLSSAIVAINAIYTVPALIDNFLRHNIRLNRRGELLFNLLITVTMLSVIAFSAFPHIFLFINAFPAAFALSSLAITSFLLSFEMILFVQGYTDYSPTKLLFNRELRVAMYERLIIPPLLHIDPNMQRQLDEAANQGEARRNAGESSAKAYQLEDKLLKELIAHQKKLIAKLPREAIIDEMALYEKHKTKLFAGKTESQLRIMNRYGMSMHDELCTQAKDFAKEEVAKLETDYLDKVPSEKKEAYLAYRHAAKIVSPLFGACPIALEEILPNSTNMIFYVTEKRFVNNDNRSKPISFAVPGLARVFTRETFLENLGNNGAYSFDAESKDRYSLPSRYPFKSASNGLSYDTHWRFHEYQIVEGHGLSLNLCDAIEEFLDPTLVPRRQIPRADKPKPKTENPEKKATQQPVISTTTPRQMPSYSSSDLLNSFGTFLTAEELAEARLLQEQFDASSRSSYSLT